MTKLADVAALAGVGVGTASRAISGKGYVDTVTRTRVLAAATELGYRPNAAARALRERRTRVVGLLLPDIVNEFYTTSAAVLQGVLADAGFQLLVATTGNDPETERHALTTMLDRQVDGIIHVPVDASAEFTTGVPMVQLNRRSDSGAVASVVSDDVEGVARLTEAIVTAGHTDLAVVVGPLDLSTSRDRLAGYRHAVEAAGLPEAHELTGGRRSRVFTVPFTADGGAQALSAMADDLPQAVVALSSRLMMGVLRECGQRRIAIPHDLSVAGLGDPDWFGIWQPGITTFAPPLADMGRRAGEMLLELMSTDDHPQTEPTIVALPGELRIRGSVQGLHR